MSGPDSVSHTESDDPLEGFMTTVESLEEYLTLAEWQLID